MKPARTSQRLFEKTKLAVIGDDAKIQHAHFGELADFFKSGDLLVVNRSGTMPSSFTGQLVRSRKPVEIRLASFLGLDPHDLRAWKVVTFGAGDWRNPTELRGAAPQAVAGDKIDFSEDLRAIVKHVHPQYPRLLEIEFVAANLISSLFTAGRPIQYSYLREALAVWDQQTLFASLPISVEPPSASFPFNWETLFRLQKRGVRIAPLLHAAGLSSTGDAEFDKLFPLDEFYEIPETTITLVAETKRRGGHVVALGTTVTRALESAFQNPVKLAPRGRTTLRLSASSRLNVIDGLITGMHEPDSSHYNLMEAFGKIDQLSEQTEDYRSHEYGDLTLKVPGSFCRSGAS